MSYDGVQQLGQTQRDVGTVVRVGVTSSPFFKVGQYLFHIAELILNVRKHCLGPQNDISCLLLQLLFLFCRKLCVFGYLKIFLSSDSSVSLSEINILQMSV